MKNTGWRMLLRIGMPACVVAVAITVSYYYGTTRASEVTALPAAIDISQRDQADPARHSSGPGYASSTSSTEQAVSSPQQPKTEATVRAQTATTQPPAPPTTVKREASTVQHSAPPSTQRDVVKSVRTEECAPEPQSHRSDSGGGGHDH